MTDWGDLIMDVQTAPDGPLSSPSAETLFSELYPYLRTVAINWQKLRNVEAEHHDDLVSIGIHVLFERIGKFTIPESAPSNIGKVFKVWAAKVCKREWDKQSSSNTPDIEYVDAEDLEAVEVPYEGLADSYSSTPQSEEMKSILNDELSKLPEHMRFAILETVAAKGIANDGTRVESNITKEIAEKHGCTPGNVRTQLSRLKQRVKARITEES